MTKEETFELIKKQTQEVVPELSDVDIKITDSLKDLGANSVDRAEILMMTMEELSLDIPRVELYGAQNIEELAVMFADKINEAE